jgi:hypothetical protein
MEEYYWPPKDKFIKLLSNYKGNQEALFQIEEGFGKTKRKVLSFSVLQKIPDELKAESEQTKGLYLKL